MSIQSYLCVDIAPEFYTLHYSLLDFYYSDTPDSAMDSKYLQ